MMQADVATAVERQASLRILDLPERHDAVSVRHERRRITLVLTNNFPTKAITKEAPCEREVFHRKAAGVEACRNFAGRLSFPESSCKDRVEFAEIAFDRLPHRGLRDGRFGG